MKYEFKDKLTAAEYLAEQTEAVKMTLNSYIRLIPKCMKGTRLSDKDIRLLPLNEFFDLIRQFTEQYKIGQRFDFLEKE